MVRPPGRAAPPRLALGTRPAGPRPPNLTPDAASLNQNARRGHGSLSLESELNRQLLLGWARRRRTAPRPPSPSSHRGLPGNPLPASPGSRERFLGTKVNTPEGQEISSTL